MANYGICRIEGYKAVANKSYSKSGDVKAFTSDTAAGILAECTRELERYSNPNYDPSVKNISLIDRACKANEYIDWLKQFRRENNIKGNLKLDGSDNAKYLTTVLNEAIITATPRWLNSLPEEKQIEYLKDGFAFLQQEFPDVYWVAAEIHQDEPAWQEFDENDEPVLDEDGEEVWHGGKHLQACFVPIYKREDGSKVISWGKIQGGYNKDFYRDLQDRWHAYLQERGYHELQRGERSENTKAKHVRPAEWRKAAQSLSECQKAIRRANDILRSLEPAVELAAAAQSVEPSKTLGGAWKLSDDDLKALMAAADTGAVAIEANMGLSVQIDDLEDELQEERELRRKAENRRDQLVEDKMLLQRENKELKKYKDWYQSALNFMENVLHVPFERFAEWHNRQLDQERKNQNQER